MDLKLLENKIELIPFTPIISAAFIEFEQLPKDLLVAIPLSHLLEQDTGDMKRLFLHRRLFLFYIDPKGLEALGEDDLYKVCLGLQSAYYFTLQGSPVMVAAKGSMSSNKWKETIDRIIELNKTTVYTFICSDKPAQINDGLIPEIKEYGTEAFVKDVFSCSINNVANLIYFNSLTGKKAYELFQWYADQLEMQFPHGSFTRTLMDGNYHLKMLNNSLREEVEQCNDKVQVANSFVEIAKSKYQADYEGLFAFYHREYEVLPIWYKRFGHIIKVIIGKRTFRSLFDDSLKNNTR